MKGLNNRPPFFGALRWVWPHLNLDLIAIFKRPKHEKRRKRSVRNLGFALRIEPIRPQSASSLGSFFAVLTSPAGKKSIKCGFRVRELTGV